jgi:hypothetical protein
MIAKWLEHADPRTVQKYIHITEAHSEKQARRAEAIIAAGYPRPVRRASVN